MSKKVFWNVLFFLPMLWDNPVFAQEKILWTTDWSADGKFIATGGNADSLKIYSATDLKLVRAYPKKNTITCVKWHPTKNLLAIATQSSSDKVRILDIETNNEIALEGISPDGARGLGWSYSGDFLAVGDNDGQIFIFDEKGKLLRTIKQENTKSITGLAWHPKENIFTTVGDKIRIYDLNGTLLRKFTHRKEDVLLLCVAWHNSGTFFVTGDYGDHQMGYPPLLQFWSKDGTLLKTIVKSKSEYRTLSWNKNRLATASDALRIWGKSGKLLYEGVSESNLWGVAWDKSGNRLVTTSFTQKTTLWSKKAVKVLVRE